MRSASIFLTLIGSAFGYDLVTTYSGPTFFAGWDYYSHWQNHTKLVSGGCARGWEQTSNILMVCPMINGSRHSSQKLTGFWFLGGQIAIFEGINLATNNQMTLPTFPGCTQPKDVDQTRRTNHTDCGSTPQGRTGRKVF